MAFIIVCDRDKNRDWFTVTITPQIIIFNQLSRFASLGTRHKLLKAHNWSRSFLLNGTRKALAQCGAANLEFMLPRAATSQERKKSLRAGDLWTRALTIKKINVVEKNFNFHDGNFVCIIMCVRRSYLSSMEKYHRLRWSNEIISNFSDVGARIYCHSIFERRNLSMRTSTFYVRSASEAESAELAVYFINLIFSTFSSPLKNINLGLSLTHLTRNATKSFYFELK